MGAVHSMCGGTVKKREFPMCFWGRAEVSFHEVPIEWLLKDGGILGKGKMQKKSNIY